MNECCRVRVYCMCYVRSEYANKETIFAVWRNTAPRTPRAPHY